MKLMAIFLLLPLTLFSQDGWKNIYSSGAWKERDRWQKPDEIIALLKLSAGSQTADIGCHEGYMTFKLSKVVGSSGKVFAVDVDEPKLVKINSMAEELRITNIVTVKGDYDNPKLPISVLDAVLILDAYHEMDDHDLILQHIKKALKPGGRLLLCEPIASSRRKMSREQQESKHELGMAYALEDLRKAGFDVVFKKDPYIDRKKEKQDEMWVIVAEKKR